MIENTSSRDPLLHLLGAMSDGPSGYIEGMEAAGQRQLVASQQIPIKGSDELEALGFKLGAPTDDLFRTAKLPEGWTKRPSDHDMWSYIDDQLGRERVAIFYKAAFYDRRAFCRAADLRSYVFSIVCSAAPLVLDDQWATAEAVRAEALKAAASEDGEAAAWTARIDDPANATRVTAEWATYRDDHVTRAAAYRALAAQVTT